MDEIGTVMFFIHSAMPADRQNADRGELYFLLVLQMHFKMLFVGAGYCYSALLQNCVLNCILHIYCTGFIKSLLKAAVPLASSTTVGVLLQASRHGVFSSQ